MKAGPVRVTGFSAGRPSCAGAAVQAPGEHVRTLCGALAQGGRFTGRTGEPVIAALSIDGEIAQTGRMD